MRSHAPLFALLALGCVPDFEDDLSTIREPRLLAIQAEPAEVEEGAAVTFRALVAAPEGVEAGSPRWSLCLTRKPLTELGPISPQCLDVSDDGRGHVAELGVGLQVAATLPDDACRLFGPTRPEPQPGELPGRPVDPDTTGGYYQPATGELEGVLSIGSVRLSCGLSAASRTQIQSYNERYRPNENPALTRVELGDLELDEAIAAPVAAGAGVGLRAVWDECPREPVCGDQICSAFEDRTTCAEDCELARGCRGAEAYVSFDGEAGRLLERRESLRVAWYASGGVFERELTGREEGELVNDTTNTWRAPREPGTYTLWLVLRDSRGGASWRSYRVEVQP